MNLFQYYVKHCPETMTTDEAMSFSKDFLAIFPSAHLDERALGPVMYLLTQEFAKQELISIEGEDFARLISTAAVTLVEAFLEDRPEIPLETEVSLLLGCMKVTGDLFEYFITPVPTAELN